MILDVLRLEDEVKAMKGDPKAGNKFGQSLSNAEKPGEIGRLQKELEKKDKELQAMKSQSEGLSKEYNRMGDSYNTSDSTPKKDR